jgi:hypothetical protein
VPFVRSKRNRRAGLAAAFQQSANATYHQLKELEAEVESELVKLNRLESDVDILNDFILREQKAVNQDRPDVVSNYFRLVYPVQVI